MACARCHDGTMATVEQRGGKGPQALDQGQQAGGPAGLSPPPEEELAQRSHRRLRRLPERGLIAGVCAGLAEYSGADVLVIRLLVATGAVAGGGGGGVLCARRG